MSKAVIGAAAGFILVLLVQGREPAAVAAPAQGVDNQGKFTLAVGGSEPNRYDMVWVLHEHPPHPKLKSDRGDDGGFMKNNQITLALYKIERQGEKMKFVASRDIAYDLEYQDFGQLEPTASDVYQKLKAKAK